MKRFVLFGMGSTVGAGIDFIIGLALLHAGFGSWAALALAMSVSATVVYVIHQKITFADLGSGDLHAGRMGAFLASTGLVYLIRLAVLEGLLILGALPALALGTALVASVAVNFGVSRTFIFADSRRKS